MKTSQDNVELFPYESFGVRLEHINEKRICWFKDDYELQKYLERYKLDKRTIKIDYRDGKPPKSSKTDKNSLEQRTRKTSSGGSSRSRGSTKKLDSTGTFSRTRKPKSK